MTLVTINTKNLQKSLIFYYKDQISNDFTDSLFINIENFRNIDTAYETIVELYSFLKQKPSNFFLTQYEHIIFNKENARNFLKNFEDFTQEKGLSQEIYQQLVKFSQDHKQIIFCGFLSMNNHKNFLEECFIDFYTNSNQKTYQNISVVSVFSTDGNEANIFYVYFQDSAYSRNYITSLKNFFPKIRFFIELTQQGNFNMIATELVENEFRYFYMEEFDEKEYLIAEFDISQPIMPKDKALQQLKNIEKYLYIDYQVKREKDNSKLYEKTGICRENIYLEPELLTFMKKLSIEYKVEIGCSYQKIDDVKVRLPDGNITTASRIGVIPESLVKGSMQTYAVNPGYYRINSHTHPSYIYPKFGAKLAWPSNADFIFTLMAHYPGNSPLKNPLKSDHYLEQNILHFVISVEGLYTIQIPYKMAELLDKFSNINIKGLSDFISLLKYILTNLEVQRSEKIDGKERTQEEYINTVNSYLEFTNKLTIGDLFILNDPTNSLTKILKLDLSYIQPLLSSLEKSLVELGINKYIYSKYSLFSSTFTPWELAMDPTHTYFDKGMIIHIETFISRKDTCPLSIDIRSSVPSTLFKVNQTIIPDSDTMIKFDDLVENFPDLHLSIKDYFEKCHPTYIEEDSNSFLSYSSPRPSITPQEKY